MELTIKNLENCFNRALENNANYLGIKVQLEEKIYSEVIINERKNFAFKWNYYKKAYNVDLTHRHNEKIKIIGFTYGNTFEDIERDLCKGE